MHVVVLSNPRSGSGRAATCAPAILTALNSAGITTSHIPVGPGAPPADLAYAARGAHALVVIGGDGTVRNAAPAAIATGAPIYHVPCGNENLFAREFGMTADPRTLLAALHRHRLIHIDLAEAHWSSQPAHPTQPTQPALFLLMASFGPDAGVIHRLHATRTSARGHSAYLSPILDELRNPSLPRLTVEADGRRLIDNRTGLLVIANCRQYAFRVDPCPGASMTDGLLDIAFMPADSATDVLAWFIRARLRRHQRSPHLIATRARRITIHTPAGPAPLQIDGEAMPPGPPHAPLEITVSPGILPVLDTR